MLTGYLSPDAEKYSHCFVHTFGLKKKTNVFYSNTLMFNVNYYVSLRTVRETE